MSKERKYVFFLLANFLPVHLETLFEGDIMLPPLSAVSSSFILFLNSFSFSTAFARSDPCKCSMDQWDCALWNCIQLLYVHSHRCQRYSSISLHFHSGCRSGNYHQCHATARKLCRHQQCALCSVSTKKRLWHLLHQHHQWSRLLVSCKWLVLHYTCFLPLSAFRLDKTLV